MLGTNRYGTQFWKHRQLIHSICGSLIAILTLIAGITILRELGYEFFYDHVHNAVGIIYFVLVMGLVCLGIFILIFMKVVNMDWQTEKLRHLKKLHAYFGYFVLVTI